jgi:hypothetical protein
MKVSMKKAHQFTVRLTPELRASLDRACELTGLDAATVARACLQAFIEEVEATGEIRLPLSVIPKSERKKSLGDYPRSSSTAPFSVNEEPPARETKPITGARLTLREMGEREKYQPSKK